MEDNDGKAEIMFVSKSRESRDKVEVQVVLAVLWRDI